MSKCIVCYDLDPESGHGRLNWKINVAGNARIEHRLDFEVGQIEKAASEGCPNCAVIMNGLRIIRAQYANLNHTMDVERKGQLILRVGCPLQLQFRKSLRLDYFSMTGMIPQALVPNIYQLS